VPNLLLLHQVFSIFATNHAQYPHTQLFQLIVTPFSNLLSSCTPQKWTRSKHNHSLYSRILLRLLSQLPLHSTPTVKSFKLHVASLSTTRAPSVVLPTIPFTSYTYTTRTPSHIIPALLPSLTTPFHACVSYPQVANTLGAPRTFPISNP